MQDATHPAIGQIVPVSEKEMDVAFSGPAPGSNKFIITIGQPGVRIAFVETNPSGTEAFFRNAVTLHPLEAISLHRVLRTMLKDLEQHFVESQTIKPDVPNV